MAFEGWETRPDGTIKVCPLTAWETFRPYGMMCGIRVHYADSEQQLLSGEFATLPLIMTAAQARELAGVFSRLADKAETPPDDETAQ